VNVQDVELMIAGDLGHFYRKWQRVVGILEELVVVDDDGMEPQSRRADGQAERPLVSDEMHIVPPSGEFLAER
jgi:hypothetical protein